MDKFQDDLKKAISSQTQALKTAEKFLKSAPDGYLAVRNRIRRQSYYLAQKKRTASGWKSIQKNITDSPDLIELLTEKKIAGLTKKICTRNIAAMEKLLSRYQSYDKAEILGGLPEKYQDAAAMHRHKQIDAWAHAPYEKCPFDPEKHIHETLSGELVRSKSEVIIANALFSYGIPFHYEEKFPYPNENGDFYYPDFTIMLPDGTTLIWEHLGLLTNMTYCINNAQKLHTYQQNQFIIGKNLILTQDDSKGNCNSIFTYQIIEQYLLPYFEKRAKA